ncbi:MBL fold metallo-hydrolase [Chitinimonas sp. BJB300]|uniref:MBL fold metallo-hydrolase n=1 Tax=Chitinimonas sp. BJB300 TaxID=1559339 RepID=UPI000C0FD13A|nr:MBL fold metallo-hydrolase [Chitinimonas sp. BJB300]PHV11731.1 MBL fold metallo-hydrolase [Chitinimonas sp. BJB300]TSJ90008.1 MBL fold metallo-hydrolase [Chitinimonas sp. BJB300]
MTVEVLILGCGSSTGTPAIGCTCPTCTSTDPRNRRTRASSVFRTEGLNFLIDTGPDLRTQALREGLTQVDAVLYTHPHADHLNGIDDLRAYCYLNKAPLPIFGNAFMMQDVVTRFHYTTLPPGTWWDKPVLLPTPVDGPFSHRGVTITPLPVMHGRWPIYGYRIGNAAYITDVSEIPEESYALLDGLELLLLDCLRNEPHYTHFGVEQSLATAKRIGARRTIFIHMTHELEYHALTARLPEGIEVAYDGMRLDST